jgi:hypothetical protein
MSSVRSSCSGVQFPSERLTAALRAVDEYRRLRKTTVVLKETGYFSDRSMKENLALLDAKIATTLSRIDGLTQCCGVRK